MDQPTTDQQREEAFRALALHTPDVIQRWDRDLRWVYVNPATERIAKRPAAEFLGKTHADLGVPAERVATLEAHIRAVFETGEPREEVLRSIAGDRWYLVQFIAERGADGRTAHVMMVARDVTAQTLAAREAEARRAEHAALLAEKIAALEAADALKDQFLSILSHELRTPLNAILAFASLLEEEVSGPLTSPQRRDVARIIGGAEAMLALVKDLLDMSRIQAGKFMLAPEPCEFQAIAADALATLASLAARKRQRLRADVPDGLPPLQADPQRVGQVLANLVGNAIKFTPEGGAIDVDARVAGGLLRCEITDDGPGIAPEDVSRLFRPFTQLDMSRTRPKGGTGLGLSIARALVEAHGGTIGVARAPGRGSTFWFTLPLDGQPPKGRPA